MTIPDPQTLAQIFAERALNTAGAGIILAGLVTVLLRIVRRQNSGTRFAIWFSALLTLVAFPFVPGSFLLPVHLRVLSVASQHGPLILSAGWASYLFAAWALGASFMLLRLGLGLWRVYAVRRDCSEVNLTGLDSAGIFQVLKTRDPKSRRDVKLCISDDLAVPAAVGLFRPAIVFPTRLWPQLSAAEIEMIVRHELAHLCRWDDWTNLAQKFVKALFFFHPVVWWIENRLALEREMACDDMVLEQTGSPRLYASSLISFAEKLQSSRHLVLAQALVSRMHEMSARLAQILDAKRPVHSRLWKPALGLNAGLLVLVLAAIPYMPHFVAFENPSVAPAAPQVASAIGNEGMVGQGTPAQLSRLSAEKVMVAQPKLKQAKFEQAVPRQNFVVQPTAIPAAFHQPTAAMQGRPKAAAQHSRTFMRTMLVQTRTMQQKPRIEETIFILRAPEFLSQGADGAANASAPAVWTFCIWRFSDNEASQEKPTSAIIVSLI